ncbi:MAG: hypothetical protein ACXQS7_06025 [Candidatus Syntropharchaeia archaeon]
MKKIDTASIVVVLLAILLVSPVSAELIGNHDITLVNHTFDGTYSTWTYSVTSGSDPSLSHWVIAWCNPDVIVDASESYEYGIDPKTGIEGIKFDEEYADGETRIVWFRLLGDWCEDDICVGTKAGSCDCCTCCDCCGCCCDCCGCCGIECGYVTGPLCGCKIAAPTPTPTPPTTVPTLTLSGMMTLMGLLTIAGIFGMRRRG